MRIECLENVKVIESRKNDNLLNEIVSLKGRTRPKRGWYKVKSYLVQEKIGNCGEP